MLYRKIKTNWLFQLDIFFFFIIVSIRYIYNTRRSSGTGILPAVLICGVLCTCYADIFLTLCGFVLSQHIPFRRAPPRYGHELK